MLQKSGRLVLWEAMFILELHSAETQGNIWLYHKSIQPTGKNNIEKFDEDFMIELTDDEVEDLRSNFLTANLNSKSRYKKNQIDADSIYGFLGAFNEVYSECTDAEKKQFMQAFIERIDIFQERREDGNWI